MVWVTDDHTLSALLDAIAHGHEVCYDLETTGLNEHALGARVCLASLTISTGPADRDPTTWLLPLYHPESMWLGRWRTVFTRVAAALVAVRAFLIGHNVKYDSRWTLAFTDVDLADLIQWDTQVSAHLLDENTSHKLKDVAPATFGVPRWDDFDLTAEGAALRVPLIDLGLYAARDTYWTWRLCLEHRRVMQPEEQPDTPDEIEAARLGRLAVWCSMPTVATLAGVEQRGIGVDLDWIADRLAADTERADAIFRVLAHRYHTADLRPEDANFAATSIYFQRWADEAVRRGDLRIAALTPTGRPQWSKAVLVRQARGGSRLAEAILAWRRLTKETEFLISWLEHASPDHRIHASFNTGSVSTGRLSSSDPNMQQVTKALRPAFVPRPGHVICDFDYSMIELRTAAFIAPCQAMIEALRAGRDLHRMIVADTLHKAEAEVTADERQRGKAINFGFLFGQNAYGFREYAETGYGVTLTMDEAEQAYHSFFATWDGMAQWHARVVERAHLTGQVVSPIGRVRRVPGIHSPIEKISHGAERQAINAPVQGFASDLMQIAAASITGHLPGYPAVADAHLVGTVHDSIVAELPEDRWERVAKECLDRMVDLRPVLRRMDCDFDVPLVVEVNAGSRWGLSDVGCLVS